MGEKGDGGPWDYGAFFKTVVGGLRYLGEAHV